MIDQAKDLIAPIWEDLRAKKLWPVALGLLVAIIAVPVVLSTSSSGPSAGSSGTPVAGLPTSGLPAVSQDSGSGGGANGSAHNPFAPQPGLGGTSGKSGTSGNSGASGNSGGSGGTHNTGGGSSNPSSSGGSSGGSSGSRPKPPVPSHSHPTPTVSSLKANQAYGVSVAITNTSGGINTMNPLERLSLLPSQQQPLLVELGVLKGGKRVLFAVQHGTFVSGPGTCVPGPINCQVLFLAQDQTEAVGIETSSGQVREALFAVTGITAVNYGSDAGAMKARETESSAGKYVLDHSSLSALSLFRYEPSIGAVLDLRNLTVGGS